MKISVIIPTRRPVTLVQGLKSLQDQVLRDFEIVVVDNGPDPSIGQAVAEFAAHSGVPARCVPSPEWGVLHQARHGGARAAAGDILVYTDDDATFAPDWLQGYADAFDEHPEMVAAGGPVRPVWESDIPPWLIEYMGDYGPGFEILSIWEPWEEFQLEPGGFFFYGVNMAIRRDTLFEVGGFNPEAYGDFWVGDGESGLNRKLGQHDLMVGYVPHAMVYHHIPAGRLTVDYFCQRMANEGACLMYTEYHGGIPSRLRLCRRLAGLIVRNARQWRAARACKGRTDVEALQMQMDAARTRAQARYVVRLLTSKKFRQLVVKENWLEPA